MAGKGAIQIRNSTQPVRERVSGQEWKLRCELAAAHRLIAHFSKSSRVNG